MNVLTNSINPTQIVNDRVGRLERRKTYRYIYLNINILNTYYNLLDIGQTSDILPPNLQFTILNRITLPGNYDFYHAS